MNKTVNINLAGIFFHIDEDAYLKLQRYLESIKRSFTDSQGRSEIIADIELRISELFNERIQNNNQVIGNKEVEDVIAIMGQPEDYLVDDEIFEDNPYEATNSGYPKKLFRDTDNSYIAGVSSGLGHYLGIDPVWVRLLWVILTFFSGGAFILIYILFWVIVPEALSTSDKLMMRGKPVNISNIEQNIKKGFDNVSDNLKNVDYEKYSTKVRSGSKSFFDALGDMFSFIFKIIGKFIGLLMVIIGAVVFIALFISIFAVGIFDFNNFGGFDIVDAANATNVPIWFISIMLFFAVGIPFLFLFYFGLKILVSNLKPMRNTALFSLIGVWALSVIGMLIIGAKFSNEYAYDASVETTKTYTIKSTDTIAIKMNRKSKYQTRNRGRNRSDEFSVIYDENDRKSILITDVNFAVKSTKDSIGYIEVYKYSNGRSYSSARGKADNIRYNLTFENNELILDNYLIAPYSDGYRQQEVELFIYLPEGSHFIANDNTYYRHRNPEYKGDILKNGMEGHILKVGSNKVECTDCETEEIHIEETQKQTGININDDAVRIKTESMEININDDGVEGKNENVRYKIDDDGVRIKTEDN